MTNKQLSGKKAIEKILFRRKSSHKGLVNMRANGENERKEVVSAILIKLIQMSINKSVI